MTSREVAPIINAYYKKYATHVERTLAFRRMTAMSKITPCNKMALMACLFDWNAVYVRANIHMGFKVKVSSYDRLKQLNIPDKVIKPIQLYPKKLRNDFINGYTWSGYGKSPFNRVAQSSYLPEVMLMHDCLRVIKEHDLSQLDALRLENNITALLKDVM